ncbi:pyridoxamine 5'-phosphate oxidase family protein [Novosphingobium sp. G106]|uniref:pyridoxamine 5'-phosphate oxidase family protein n=1 Tax=Novosphingobium sp. G106 TaxID=2849500 RepID=UPI001C2DC64F|nr:pyridoxamine 5'-phosphate oxidase family protein [Novosphingobium sp. G106]MBV1691528.1 pyridoxamine 5'-phosphate oxidase family protein [Novosphingobium sp. G106]
MLDSLHSNTSAIWHPGERAIQQSFGIAERMEEVGRQVIRPFMPDQHRAFYAQLPFVVAGSVDSGGDAWATLLAGRPGFVSSPSPTILELQVGLDPADPASEGLGEGDAVGLLGIELHTRRRNRANGVLRGSTAGTLHFELDQSFGNCPKYIQLRDYIFVRDPAEPFAGEVLESAELDAAARVMITAADTFFVASYADEGGRRQVDVSHRGGRPGFVRIGDDGTLTIPDFSGNMFFSTLGNILVNGNAGLLFVDFETGDLLQLSGDAEVILDSPEIAELAGAERLWKFRARRVVWRPAALPLRWEFREDGWSPFALRTGDWPQHS